MHMLISKKPIFILFLSFIFINSFIRAQQFSQNSNHEQAQFNTGDKNLSNLTESRKLVLSNIETDQIDKARKIIFELDSVYDNSNIQAFRVNERWMLSFWINELTSVIEPS